MYRKPKTAENDRVHWAETPFQLWELGSGVKVLPGVRKSILFVEDLFIWDRECMHMREQGKGQRESSIRLQAEHGAQSAAWSQG